MKFTDTSTELNFDCCQKSPQITAAGMLLTRIAAPIVRQSWISSCWVCSRTALPEVVELVNSSLTPPFSRMPLEPRTQPAASSSTLALAGSYLCCGRAFWDDHGC